MAKLKIFTFPDLVLTKKANPIARVEKSFFKTADDMLETMYHAPGVGLAANQVGLLQRIIVIDTDYEMVDLDELKEDSEGQAEPLPKIEDGAEVVGSRILHKKKPRILINPEIIHREGKILFSEGCLSVPEYNAEVQRSEKVKVQYQDLDGLTRTLSAEGLLAIAIQHEIDHLEGKLFIDRLSPLKKEMAKKKLKKERAERDSGNNEGPEDL